jgi:SHS2 domain-containing protein
MTPFKILDMSGDAGLTAYGNTKEEAFINAATGMYSLITDPGSVLEKKAIHISVENQSPDSLLVSWLNELVFHFDAYGFIGKKIVVEHFSDNKIKARISGEEFSPDRHEGNLLIKAATYHKLRIEKKDNQWEIDVVFDI